MMTLENTVELVIFAFEKSNPGDSFFEKFPAASIEVLAQALFGLYNTKAKVRIISARHGEELIESLVNRAEMASSNDFRNYYSIPANTRDLNCGKYFVESEVRVSQAIEYLSRNTERLDMDGMKKLLMKFPMVRKDVLGESMGHVYEP